MTLVEFPGGNSNRYMKVGQVNPQAMAGGAESQAGGGAPAFLTGDQIRQRLAGNTIKFFNRRRKANVLLFLGADGVATGWIDGASGGDVRQTWWIGEDDRLCRQLGPKKRQVCNTLAIDGEGFAFHKKDGSVLFRATLLPGNQVSGQTIQESPAGRGGRGPAGGQGGGTGRGAPDPAQMIGRMDADGDGVVSREEFPGPAQRFDMVDADGDGFLRAEEFAQAMAGRGAQRGGDGQRMTARPSGGGQGSAGGRQEPSAQDMIGRMDRDGDGKIGPDEFPGGADPFKKLDTNKDGFITEDEIETRLAKRSEYPLDREARQAYRQARRLPGRTDGRDCRFDRPGPGSGHFVVETYSPNCAFNGTTLFIDRTNRTRPVILELDMAGKVVWQHKVKDGVGRWLTDKWMYDSAAVDASRLASGNTLFLLLNYGVFEIDRAGKLVWERRDGKISHDADRLPNGNTIYVRAWTNKGDDQVREVDPDGNIVWSWTGVADFDGPEFAPRKNPKKAEPGDASGDGWMHTNAVTRLPDGRTVISTPYFHRVLYVDRGGRVVESVPVIATHDPEVLDNGNLLVAWPDGAIEFSNGRPVWLWDQGTPKNIALPKIWMVRDVNRLPNGNTLITSGNRLIEVDAAGEVVWQLLNTKVRADQADKGISFFKATRIGPDGRAYGG